MKLNLKARRKPDACDVQRCRAHNGLVIVVDAEEGEVKLCAPHLAKYNEADVEAESGEGTNIMGDPVAGGIDQSSVLAIVEPVRAEAAEQLGQLSAIKLTTQAAIDMAGELLQQVKGQAKSLEAQRTSVTKPLLDAKRSVDAWFKPAKVALGALEAHLKAGIAEFVTAQEQARVAALEAGDHEGALAVAPAVLPAGIQTRTTWKFEVVDADAIPREYLVPDAAKIASHVAMHKANSSIPGVRAYPDTGISAGSKASS